MADNENKLPGEVRELIDPVLDILDEGVVVHDENRRILFFNEAAERVTGLNRNDVVGRDCHAVFGKQGLCSGACAFRDNHSHLEATDRHIVVPFTRTDGAERLLKMDTRGMDTKRLHNGAVSVFRDVTDTVEGPQDRKSFHGIMGQSRIMQRVFETIKAVGKSQYPVLITGESGTGKELVARAVHLESDRKNGPFVPVNCGALPENILESELFGHVRGAFTGAIKDKKGRFELAQNGTMLLDEIGELPLQVQVKLLRVLQEKTIERLGGEKSVRINARIVAATNKNLEEMIVDGSFREDLFYRLCVVPIHLPPLRERRGDIPLIAHSIVEHISRESGNKRLQLTNDAIQLLTAYDWPGNIRELMNVLQYASIVDAGIEIRPEHLPANITSGNGRLTSRPPVSPVGASPVIANQNRFNGQLTRDDIMAALQQTDGNKAQAAKVLGVGRATLYRHINRLNLDAS